jgi:hypothetical protein
MNVLEYAAVICCARGTRQKGHAFSRSVSSMRVFIILSAIIE